MTDRESYYLGRTAGDVTMMVVGTVETIKGIGTLAAGFAGEAGGTMLDMTGIGAVIGVPVQIVSTAAVVEGVLVTANGVCLYGASLDNFNNNLDKMNDAKKLERPDTDSIKDPKEVESEKIGKLKDEVEGIGGKSGSEGGISIKDLESLVPEGTPNTFKPTSTIKNGAKYEFTLDDGQKVIIRWHEPDPVAASKYPGCISGSRYTAEIKVGNKQLKVDGGWSRNQAINDVNVPIKGK